MLDKVNTDASVQLSFRQASCVGVFQTTNVEFLFLRNLGSSNVLMSELWTWRILSFFIVYQQINQIYIYISLKQVWLYPSQLQIPVFLFPKTPTNLGYTAIIWRILSALKVAWIAGINIYEWNVIPSLLFNLCYSICRHQTVTGEKC